MDNKEKLLIIINKILEVKGLDTLEKINPSDKLREDLGLDSFDLAELTVIIEEDYDVDIFSDGIVENISEILDKIDKSNSNNLFFLDVKNNVSLSYSNLLKNFTSKDFVITDGNFDNAKDFLINFISALYYGFDIKINDLGVLNNKKK